MNDGRVKIIYNRKKIVKRDVVSTVPTTMNDITIKTLLDGLDWD